MRGISEIPPIVMNPKLILKFLLRKRSLAKLLGCNDHVISEFLKEADKLTSVMLNSARVEGAVGTMLSPLRGPVVYVCVRALKPDIMVETGVASGASTYYILQAMEFNGKGALYSIDLPNIDSGAVIPKHKEIGWLVPERLRHRWQLTVGRSKEILPNLLPKLRVIDAFLHDSEHTYENMMFEYEIAWRYLGDGGCLLSDDVHWNEAFCHFVSRKKPRRWKIFDGVGVIIK